MGFVMTSENMSDKVITKLENDNKFAKDTTKEQKKKIANRKLLDHVVTKDIKVSTEDWRECKIAKIHNGIKTEKDGTKKEVIYTQFEHIEDVNMIKHYLTNLNQKENNRVIPYIHPMSYERFKKIDWIAFELRQKGQQTRIKPHGKMYHQQ